VRSASIHPACTVELLSTGVDALPPNLAFMQYIRSPIVFYQMLDAARALTLIPASAFRV
jgi:type I site-specific restriction endonuclease